MRVWFIICLACAVAASGAEPGEVFRRGPEYYAVRLGPAEKTADVDAHAFWHPGHDDPTEVRRRFAVRNYRGPDLRVEAVFFRPELVLAAVTIERPGGWTVADLDALLAEYGGRWRRIADTVWVSDEGTRARLRDRTFHLVSARLVGEMDAARQSGH